MKVIGYARVSTRDQNLEMQLNALTSYGCEKVFKEKMSGKLAERPVFNEMLTQAKEGDTIVVWKVDRLGRSARHVCEVLEAMKNKGVVIVSITEGVNTGTPIGAMFCQLAGVFAEMEISNRSERTKEGLKNARKKGKKLGRPKGYSISNSTITKIWEDLNQGLTKREISEKYGLSPSTLYRYQKERMLKKTYKK